MDAVANKDPQIEYSDEALVLACRRGDAAAWDTLVERYQRLVYSIPRRGGLDEHLAADVFQHVFATLVEHIDRLEQPDRIGAWLVTVARRETMRIRKIAANTRQERGDLTADGEAVERPDHDPLPDAVLIRLQQQQQVRHAVTSLHEPCRTLLTLLYYVAEPPSYGDIALRLGRPEGSIGPMRARCLQKLGALLADLRP